MKHYTVEFRFRTKPLYRRGREISERHCFVANSLTEAYLLARAYGLRSGKRLLSLTALLLCFALLAAPARGQTVRTGGSCAEESSGGSPNNFGVTATAGDMIVVPSLSYIGGGTVSNATWSSGTATITVDSQSATSGTITVTGVNPAGYNGTFTLTGHSGTSVSYALASNPGTYVSGGYIGGAVQSVSDTNGDTFTRLPADASGNPPTYALTGGGVDFWIAQNVAAAGGGETVSVNYTPGDQFNASCVLSVGGMPASGSPTDAIGNSLVASGTTFDTATIGGNQTHEFFYATANIAGTLSGTGVAACGGNTFTAVPGGNGQGGDPAGYFVTGATTGGICAGLNQTPSGPAAAQIISLLSTSSAPPASPFKPRRFIQFSDWLPWPMEWLLGAAGL